MLSAIVYLTLGVLVTHLVPDIVSKLYIMVIAITLAGLVGLSRGYLGVHWPSDVPLGWATVAVWAFGGDALAQCFHLGKFGKQ